MVNNLLGRSIPLLNSAPLAGLQGLGLVFVAVYQKALKLLYVDELLERVRKEFSPRYKPNCYEYKVCFVFFPMGAHVCSVAKQGWS